MVLGLDDIPVNRKDHVCTGCGEPVALARDEHTLDKCMAVMRGRVELLELQIRQLISPSSLKATAEMDAKRKGKHK